MFEWKKKELVLMKKTPAELKEFESSFTFEDAITFVDQLQDGKLSYVRKLRRKYEKDEDSLPKTRRGSVKRAALKDWIRQNDTRELLDVTFTHGRIEILGCGFQIQWDSFGSYVDRVFHCQIAACIQAEKEYYQEHHQEYDEYEVLKNRYLENPLTAVTSLGVNVVEREGHRLVLMNEEGQMRDITKEELGELLSKYEELQQTIDKLTKEIHITY